MANSPVDTPPKQKAAPFQPGQSGNPAGRPKGARSKLGEAFIQALHDDFTEHGAATIITVRETKPDQYLKVIASLLPKDVNLNINDQFGEMSDDELVQHIRELDAAISPFLAGLQGPGTEGTASKGRAVKPADLHRTH